MAQFLSESWLADHRELADGAWPERPGATASIQHLVTTGRGAAAKTVAYHLVIEDGRLVGAGLGELPDADITLATSREDAVAMASGALDPSAGFMQGRVKLTGDMGRYLSLLPLLQSAEHRAVTAALHERTTY